MGLKKFTTVAVGLVYKINYNMKQIIFSHWDFLRWLRLVMGLILIPSGISSHDYFASAFGLFFMGQAVFNIGCCSSGTCYAERTNKTDDKTIEDVRFEEIKTK